MGTYGSLMELTNYFVFYNDARPHQSLGYETPGTEYKNAKGGGAKVVDKFGERNKTSKGKNWGSANQLRP